MNIIVRNIKLPTIFWDNIYLRKTPNGLNLTSLNLFGIKYYRAMPDINKVKKRNYGENFRSNKKSNNNKISNINKYLRFSK